LRFLLFLKFTGVLIVHKRRISEYIAVPQTCTAGGRNVSILDSVTKMVEGSSGGGGDHAAVAGGLMQQLGGVGGIAGLIQTFHQNGAGGLVQQFASGQTQATDPNAMGQALAGSGLVDGIAQRTGMSADAVRSSLATIVPVLINHVTANGHVTTDGQATGAPAPETGSLLQSVLGKIL
jgi:uncharacterized protein YidB (DUF937 family)